MVGTHYPPGGYSLPTLFLKPQATERPGGYSLPTFFLRSFAEALLLMHRTYLVGIAQRPLDGVRGHDQALRA